MDGCRLSSCHDGLVEMSSKSLTVAPEGPASLASFKSAVVVEINGEDPLGPAHESVFWDS
eukprot:5778878-Pleurochrysis_carterae.AAC.1